MLELGGFQVALVLFAGVWGALGITINIFTTLNERRDLLLRITERESPLSAAQERVLLYNNWLPLWLGSCLFLAFISAMFYLLPNLVICKPQGSVSLKESLDVCQNIKTVCRLASALAGFGFLADLTAGFSDIRFMRSTMDDHIREAKRPKYRHSSKAA